MGKPIDVYKCVVSLQIAGNDLKNKVLKKDTYGNYRDEEKGLYSSNLIEKSTGCFIPVSQDGETKEEMLKAQKSGIKYEVYWKSVSKWAYIENCRFDDYAYFYRRKPEPKYRPYTAEDLDYNQDIILKVIKPINSDTRNYIIAYNKDGVILSTGKDIMLYQLLLEMCTYIDGSPCGVLID